MEQFYTDVLEVIRKTREISLPQFGTVEVLEKKGEDAVSVVTEVDRSIESLLKKEFESVDSSIEFVGEEFGGNRDANKFWLVDSVDGTGLYTRGIVGCTTMVALIEDGQVVFGAIYDFVNDDLYYAVRGCGSFKDGVRIHVSDRGAGDAYAVFETKLEKPENYKKYQEALSYFKSPSYLCSGFEFMLVATGQLDGRIAFDPYGTDYDFAPGSLLVAEAGGVVTNIGSTSYDYQNMNYIAANPVLHKHLTGGSDALFPVTE